MPKKVLPTRTMNPLPFQDLDPHRFEDLVRNLIYDFRSWRTIEATGKAGSDEGFDVRAWEGTSDVSNTDEDDDHVGTHPMEGHLWKLQCKRERQLGPKQIKEIIDGGVDENGPPYGYILVAPATFSKKSYDVFRNELRTKGVMEFYLWGKGELEDMLLLPKNDSILFAFFGISLITRKRQRASDIKFALNNKNRLLRILADGDVRRDFHEPVLVRDFKDVHYPFKDEYKNFDRLPRWKEYSAKHLHPLGLILDVRRHFAYVNTKTREFDVCKSVDLLPRQVDERLDEAKGQLAEKARQSWKYLRRANQATVSVSGIIFFEDMLIIDEKGDSFYGFPHIFVNFKGEAGPFRWFSNHLVANDQEITFDDTYKRVSVFAPGLDVPKAGKAHKNRALQLDEQTMREVEGGRSLRSLFDVTGKYDFLNQRDIIQLTGVKSISPGNETLVEITHKYKMTVKEYLDDYPGYRQQVERQVERKLDDSDALTILEFDTVHSWGREMG